jgi:hypothetical protein
MAAFKSPHNSDLKSEICRLQDALRELNRQEQESE